MLSVVLILLRLICCEHWGAKRALEILNRHFSELGLDAQNFIKTYEQPNTIYLLDGFDEIGTQSWSSDPRKMQHLREISVCALKRSSWSSSRWRPYYWSRVLF